MKLLAEGMVCEEGGCGKPATDIAYSRMRNEAVACCDDHYFAVLEEANPEYHHTCENCGCGLPIN